MENEQVRRVNVGWLNSAFPQGKVPQACLDRLYYISQRYLRNRSLGHHECPFCPSHMRGNELEIYWGNGEIWIRGKGDIMYVAPTMIVHYIYRHAYLPPQEFIDAVLALPEEDAQKYGGNQGQQMPIY